MRSYKRHDEVDYHGSLTDQHGPCIVLGVNYAGYLNLRQRDTGATLLSVNPDSVTPAEEGQK